MAPGASGLSRRLTSLIAAAGHGKTTTLAHFLGRAAVPYVWLQLDSQDSDLATFCRYLTEGWSAALVLLAATLRRRGSVGALLRGSLPSDLFSYLADEVLAGLSADVRSFLEETAILDTCTAETCDALLGRWDSAAADGRGRRGGHRR